VIEKWKGEHVTKPLKPATIVQGYNYKAIGEHSEAAVMTKLIELRYGVLKPFGDNRRYDLVIEDAESKFWRVQCKTGRSNGEYISFTPASLYYHTRAGRTTYGSRSYHGQIDYFAVYCPENKEVYLVPVEHTGTSQLNLRLGATKNNQDKRKRWAKDCAL